MSLARKHQSTPKKGAVRKLEHTDSEERRALLEQRRAAVAHQLRRLAIELTDLDRQLDEIEQSEGPDTPSARQGHTADH
jgi:hypothetical protein